MRAVFGVVALLIVLGVIGMVAARQMKSGSRALTVGAEAATSGQATGRPDTTPPAPAGNVREQSQQLQQRVKDDVSRALEQGAAARKEAAEK